MWARLIIFRSFPALCKCDFFSFLLRNVCFYVKKSPYDNHQDKLFATSISDAQLILLNRLCKCSKFGQKIFNLNQEKMLNPNIEEKRVDILKYFSFTY